MPSVTRRQALDGFTAVDRAGTVATAVCARLFADFGARVVNVEGPAGHPTRKLPPHAGGAHGFESSALHALLSPHKESVFADSPAAVQVLEEADVVLDTRASMGTDRGRALQVVVSWFGLDGPDADQSATDQTLCCEIGLVKGIGRPDAPPVLPSGYPIQILGGVTAFVAALGPLLGAQMDGHPARGRIDVSLLESAMCLTEVGPVAFFNGGQPLPRLGINRFVPTFPGGIFEAKGGFVGVTALTPAQWQSLCVLVGHPEFADEPRFQTAIGRLLAADEIEAWLGPALRKESATHWFHAGQARRIPTALVPTMQEVLESEQLQALGAFRGLDAPALGSLRVPGAPFRLRGTPARRDGPVARLGASEIPRSRSASRVVPLGSRRTPLRAPAVRPSWLHGLRVLDLTMGWAGPLAVRHLADQGAEVIKIESTRHFDWWRGWDATPASLADQSHEKSHAFNTANRNKWGVALDLEQSRGAELFLELVRCADVVVENYSAGVMNKLGLDYATLCGQNPRLVMLSMPPFGAGGPYHAYRGYGSTVEQASGLPHLNGNPGDPPTMLHVALGDPVAGVTAAAALSVAVLHQQRTGEGQLVDLSQVEATSALGLHGLADTVLGREPERLGNRHPSSAPHGLYRCAGDDEWVAIAVESDPQWAALCARIGDPQLDAAAYRSAAGRRAAHDEIDARITEWTRAQGRDDAARTLRSAGVPAASVYDMNEVLTHPQLLARGFWQWVERAVVGVQPHPSAPYRSGPEPYGVDAPAPTLGEHGRLVLGELLGLGESELDGLERDRVIGTVPSPAEREQHPRAAETATDSSRVRRPPPA